MAWCYENPVLQVLIAAWLLAGVLPAKLDLVTPLYGAVFHSNSEEGKGLKSIQFRLEREVNAFNGIEHDDSNTNVCLLVNGTYVGCGAVVLAGRPVIFEETVSFSDDSLLLAPGINWLMLQLVLDAGDLEGGDRSVLASSRPTAVHLSPSPAAAPTVAATANHDSSRLSLEKDEEEGIHTWPSLSIVLTLTLKDVPRAMVLLQSLAHQQRCAQKRRLPPRTAEEEKEKGHRQASRDRSSNSGGGEASCRESEKQEEGRWCWLEEFFVVVPDAEAGAFETLFASPSFITHADDDDDSDSFEGSAPLSDGVKQRRAALAPPSVRVVRERSLLFDLEETTAGSFSWDTYSVAMALKLLSAKLVSTEFYLTLDADLVCTRRFHPKDLFVGFFMTNQDQAGGDGAAAAGIIYPAGTHPGQNQAGGNDTNTHQARSVNHRRRERLMEYRALYADEPQSVHPHWWDGSAATLGWENKGSRRSRGSQYPNKNEEGEEEEVEEARFGVTPAVLSTGGVFLVLGRLKEVAALEARPAAAAAATATLDWRAAWLGRWGPGYWWSEYTLYALTLHKHKLFHVLHAKEGEEEKEEESGGGVNHNSGGPWSSSSSSSSSAAAAASSAVLRTPLACNSAWWSGDLPWNARKAFDPAHSCPFAVVQSSSGQDVSALARGVTTELKTPSEIQKRQRQRCEAAAAEAGVSRNNVGGGGCWSKEGYSKEPSPRHFSGIIKRREHIRS